MAKDNMKSTVITSSY